VNPVHPVNRHGGIRAKKNVQRIKKEKLKMKKGGEAPVPHF
jgi:hypothetical protein